MRMAKLWVATVLWSVTSEDLEHAQPGEEWKELGTFFGDYSVLTPQNRLVSMQTLEVYSDKPWMNLLGVVRPDAADQQQAERVPYRIGSPGLSQVLDGNNYDALYDLGDFSICAVEKATGTINVFVPNTAPSSSLPPASLQNNGRTINCLLVLNLTHRRILAVGTNEGIELYEDSESLLRPPKTSLIVKVPTGVHTLATIGTLGDEYLLALDQSQSRILLYRIEDLGKSLSRVGQIQMEPRYNRTPFDSRLRWLVTYGDHLVAELQEQNIIRVYTIGDLTRSEPDVGDIKGCDLGIGLGTAGKGAVLSDGSLVLANNLDGIWYFNMSYWQQCVSYNNRIMLGRQAALLPPTLAPLTGGGVALSWPGDMNGAVLLFDSTTLRQGVAPSYVMWGTGRNIRSILGLQHGAVLTLSSHGTTEYLDLWNITVALREGGQTRRQTGLVQSLAPYRGGVVACVFSPNRDYIQFLPFDHSKPAAAEVLQLPDELDKMAPDTPLCPGMTSLGDGVLLVKGVVINCSSTGGRCNPRVVQTVCTNENVFSAATSWGERGGAVACEHTPSRPLGTSTTSTIWVYRDVIDQEPFTKIQVDGTVNALAFSNFSTKEDVLLAVSIRANHGSSLRVYNCTGQPQLHYSRDFDEQMKSLLFIRPQQLAVAVSHDGQENASVRVYNLTRSNLSDAIGNLPTRADPASMLVWTFKAEEPSSGATSKEAKEVPHFVAGSSLWTLRPCPPGKFREGNGTLGATCSDCPEGFLSFKGASTCAFRASHLLWVPVVLAAGCSLASAALGAVLKQACGRWPVLRLPLAGGQLGVLVASCKLALKPLFEDLHGGPLAEVGAIAAFVVLLGWLPGSRGPALLLTGLAMVTTFLQYNHLPLPLVLPPLDDSMFCGNTGGGRVATPLGRTCIWEQGVLTSAFLTSSAALVLGGATGGQVRESQSVVLLRTTPRLSPPGPCGQWCLDLFSVVCASFRWACPRFAGRCSTLFHNYLMPLLCFARSWRGKHTIVVCSSLGTLVSFASPLFLDMLTRKFDGVPFVLDVQYLNPRLPLFLAATCCCLAAITSSSLSLFHDSVLVLRGKGLDSHFRSAVLWKSSLLACETVLLAMPRYQKEDLALLGSCGPDALCPHSCIKVGGFCSLSGSACLCVSPDCKQPWLVVLTILTSCILYLIILKDLLHFWRKRLYRPQESLRNFSWGVMALTGATVISLVLLASAVVLSIMPPRCLELDFERVAALALPVVPLNLLCNEVSCILETYAEVPREPMPVRTTQTLWLYGAISFAVCLVGSLLLFSSGAPTHAWCAIACTVWAFILGLAALASIAVCALTPASATGPSDGRLWRLVAPGAQ